MKIIIMIMKTMAIAMMIVTMMITMIIAIMMMISIIAIEVTHKIRKNIAADDNDRSS
jgi:hypothetical protein